MPPAVRMQHITKRFAGYSALEDITFDVNPGRFVSIVGPSGCGKSTLLNMIAGLLPPSSGLVDIFGEPLAGLNRRASYMFQQDALLPWKTVLGNIQLGLTFRGQTGPDAEGQSLDRAGRSARFRRPKCVLHDIIVYILYFFYILCYVNYKYII